MEWVVYLAGEIHTPWRDELASACDDSGLRVEFHGPVTDHAASDDCGEAILGKEEKGFWRDHKGAGINAIRTRSAIERADMVVVKFGEKYRQWNAAFDAGYAVALQKPLVVIHPEEFTHALKEIDAAACAVAETTEQVVDIIRYVGRLESYQEGNEED